MKRGLRQFEGAEWEQRDRFSPRVFVIPSATDPMGSQAMRDREAAAQDEADRLMAERVHHRWPTIRRYREAAE